MTSPRRPNSQSPRPRSNSSGSGGGSPRSQGSSSSSGGNATSKPYALVEFPKTPPTLSKPAGHDRYLAKHYHGTLWLRLIVGKPVHVFTGTVMLGQDVGMQVPLIKTMTRGNNNEPIIQGSSLKGCIRSVFEAITNSTMAVITDDLKTSYPEDWRPCTDLEKLCPASRIFGASGQNWGWQGLLEFSDAICNGTSSTTGFMPSLYSPQTHRRGYFCKDKQGKNETAGRKFYYHFARALPSDRSKGIPVQQVGESGVFTTQLHFKNLKPAELGALLVALGQDPKHPFALKLGGGKPIGMGSMQVEIAEMEVRSDRELQERYLAYTVPETTRLSGEPLSKFVHARIAEAHAGNPPLVLSQQLQQVATILTYPGTRQPRANY